MILPMDHGGIRIVMTMMVVVKTFSVQGRLGGEDVTNTDVMTVMEQTLRKLKNVEARIV